ncbi:hypothetical protein MRB53_014286 [Persea americana]|uniref:Uncharacterized protein n=1 Tax=Persea americana TaxID=3435 RepID=A0ACC2KAC4_PERAE|nr:hypothetical protein MRB53_014286 [Persea americana]
MNICQPYKATSLQNAKVADMLSTMDFPKGTMLPVFRPLGPLLKPTPTIQPEANNYHPTYSKQPLETTSFQPTANSHQNLPPKPPSKKNTSSKPSSSNPKASSLSFIDLPYDAITEILQRKTTPSIDTSNPFTILDNCSFVDPTLKPSSCCRNLHANLEDNSSSFSFDPPPGFESSLPPLELRPPGQTPPLEVVQPPSKQITLKEVDQSPSSVPIALGNQLYPDTISFPLGSSKKQSKQPQTRQRQRENQIL